MELIYLWTKGFKNLTGGYSLSAKYNINYNSENQELKIIKNDKFIENFFDQKNKINISAIIGENGSGKSSILKLILQLLYLSSNKNNLSLETSFLIIETNDNFYYISSEFQSNLILNYDDKILHKYDNIFYSLYFNYMIDSLKDNSSDNWIDDLYHKSDDYTMPILLEPYKKNNNIDINNLNYLTRQRMILHRNSFKDNKFLTNIFNPVKVKISIDTDKILKIFQSTLDGKYTPSIKKAYKEEFSILNKRLQRIEQEERNIESLKKRARDYREERMSKTKYEKEIFFCQQRIKEYKYEIKEIILNDIPFFVLNNLYLANKIDKYHQYKRDKNMISGVDGYSFNKYENRINIFIEDNSHNTLKLRNAIKYQDYILKNTDINANEIKKYIAIDDPRLECLPSWFTVSFFDQKERTFTTLSAGEKTFYILLSTLIYQINNISSRQNLPYGNYTNMLIMLDEADLGLHPKWQRKYLYNIVETLKQSSSDLNYHIICTSHSPFIVSDLQKDNILFLNGGNVDNLGENEYTFGENIHTLLNDSFFMQKDMMMGKISENKIKNTFDFLEKVFENNKQIEMIKMTIKELDTGEDIKKKISEINKSKKKLDKLIDLKNILKSEYEKQYQYFENLRDIIGEDYIKMALTNGLEECNKFFNITSNYNDDEYKILQALKNNPDLAQKWVKDIE
ncbi:MAG: AAA family ATPase [Arcobacter sp.]|uniref:AAA family ATPase n=1 Tax=Arcobacter sp. TaxID=1872629 RepID=UPI003C7509BA